MDSQQYRELITAVERIGKALDGINASLVAFAIRDAERSTAEVLEIKQRLEDVGKSLAWIEAEQWVGRRAFHR